MLDDDPRHHPLSAGSRGMARDPALIFEQRERSTCAGCVHIVIVIVIVSGDQRARCDRNRRIGKRCGEYVERRAIR
jgi:hypothetical protein